MKKKLKIIVLGSSKGIGKEIYKELNNITSNIIKCSRKEIDTSNIDSVKKFINEACKQIGFKIKWKGKGLKEVGILVRNNKQEIIIRIEKRYFRPNEVHFLKGKNFKAVRNLKFKPKYSFKSLIKDMISYEFKHIDD